MTTLRRSQKLFRERLGDDRDRYRHVQGMLRVALRLSRIHGCDPLKAKIACFLHDVAKNEDETTLQRTLARTFGEPDPEDFPKPTWHALVAVVHAQELCGVEDPEILNAIKFHTTARPGMSLLEKVVYLADYLEKGRAFVSDALRRLALRDLDKALCATITEVTAFLKLSNQPVSRLTVAALAYYNPNNGGIG